MTATATTGGVTEAPATGGHSRFMVEAFARLGAPGYAELLARGEGFTGRVASADNPRLAKWVKRVKPKTKQCFMNAQKFALDHPDAKYYEGYWWGGLVPVHHGWVVLDGRVVDFTAEAVDRVTGRDHDPAEDDYFGVHVPTGFIRQRIVVTKMWTDLLGAYLASDATAPAASD